MIIEKTELDGVLLITPEVFKDHRGKYVEIYNEDQYRMNVANVKFVQADISMSRENVLRGLHADEVTHKLVHCLYGTIYLVVLNCNEEHKQYGQWQSFILSQANGHQVLIPPKFANGHLVISKLAIFHYLQSTYYDRGAQFTIHYNDSRFGIEWPVDDEDLILSERDRP